MHGEHTVIIVTLLGIGKLSQKVIKKKVELEKKSRTCSSAEFSRWRDLSVSTASGSLGLLNGLVDTKVETPGGHLVDKIYCHNIRTFYSTFGFYVKLSQYVSLLSQ